MYNSKMLTRARAGSALPTIETLRVREPMDTLAAAAGLAAAVDSLKTLRHETTAAREALEHAEGEWDKHIAQRRLSGAFCEGCQDAKQAYSAAFLAVANKEMALGSALTSVADAIADLVGNCDDYDKNAISDMLHARIGLSRPAPPSPRSPTSIRRVLTT